MIRDIVPDDIPWVMSLGHRRYTGDYDPGGALVMLTQAMRLETAIAWRNDHGFLVGNIVAMLWAPKRRTLNVLALCVEEEHHWASIELLRASIGWAREKGCVKWWFGSETEHEVEALARRVGARLEPRYSIDLSEGP